MFSLLVLTDSQCVSQSYLIVTFGEVFRKYQINHKEYHQPPPLNMTVVEELFLRQTDYFQQLIEIEKQLIQTTQKMQYKTRLARRERESGSVAFQKVNNRKVVSSDMI